MSQIYMGDAVYVEVADGMIKLTTRDGLINPTNTIYLQPGVWDRVRAFVDFLRIVDGRFA